jgi:hypothetical protein
VRTKGCFVTFSKDFYRGFSTKTLFENPVVLINASNNEEKLDATLAA